MFVSTAISPIRFLIPYTPKCAVSSTCVAGPPVSGISSECVTSASTPAALFAPLAPPPLETPEAAPGTAGPAKSSAGSITQVGSVALTVAALLLIL
jgi:hypothetical protein